MSTGWHAHLTADIDHGYIGVGAQVSFESYRFDSFSWSETGKEYLLAVWHFQVISARKFFKFFLWLIVGLGKFSADNGWVTTVRGGV